MSHPGPDPSISDADLKTGQMVSRRYRNRRIGEFLKELDFTEGRRTGVPKMRRALLANGSPEPIFYTDAARLSFWTEIKVHPAFLTERVPTLTPGAQVEAPDQDTVEDTVNDTEFKILRLSHQKPASRQDILIELGHKIFSGNIRLGLKRLREKGLIVPTVADKPSSKNQRYRITEKGKQVLQLLISKQSHYSNIKIGVPS